MGVCPRNPSVELASFKKEMAYRKDDIVEAFNTGGNDDSLPIEPPVRRKDEGKPRATGKNAEKHLRDLEEDEREIAAKKKLEGKNAEKHRRDMEEDEREQSHNNKHQGASVAPSKNESAGKKQKPKKANDDDSDDEEKGHTSDRHESARGSRSSNNGGVSSDVAPIINDYKLDFFWRRWSQTALGGMNMRFKSKHKGHKGGVRLMQLALFCAPPFICLLMTAFVWADALPSWLGAVIAGGE